MYQLVTPSDLQELEELEELEAEAVPFAAVMEIEKVQEHIITHHRYTHQSVEIKVQTLANFRKVIAPIFESVKNSITEGELDTLPQLLEVRGFKKELEDIEKFLGAKALDQAQRLHPQELKNLGWEIGSTGDKYDYEQDQEYARLKYLLKEREEKLKRASKLGKFTGEETGEEIHPVQIKTFATEFVRQYNPPKKKEK